MRGLKILWLSVTSGLYNSSSLQNRYYGGGWISSLQEILIKNNNVELGLAFVSSIQLNIEKQNGTTYFPIFKRKESRFKKILKYYGVYKDDSVFSLQNSIHSIIETFKPDVIHLFGLENPLACILGNTSIPVVVHLQGILSPIDNAYWPVEFNKTTVLWPPTLSEWILRNGHIYRKKNLHKRAERLSEIFGKVQYCMGRTEWDKQMSSILSPTSQYYHVDEVLRSPFYENENRWSYIDGKFIITSTVSETIYKGLDLILKTAKILTSSSNFDFEWRVIGINTDSAFVRLFERVLGIKSKDVNIRYCGVNNADQIVANLLESSVYVHPSYIDNSPNSICEAQIVGIPVIACNVGGVPTLLAEGKAGTQIPANAPFEMVYHLINLQKHQSVYEEKRLYGLTLAHNRHNKDAILASLINVYTEVSN